MFKLLGALLALYTVQAAVKGEVYAKSGIWGRTIYRDQSTWYFWSVILIYATLSLALLTVL
jgi:hypothetical protein